jgi:fumarate reductase flavoprotein subunit
VGVKIKERKWEWDRETDVVVVGSGGAGAAAALSAYEGGVRKILILEKAPFSGGASAIAGGAIATSRSKLDLQKKHGVKDSKRLHYEDTMKVGGYLGNPTLVKKLCDDAPNTIDWMIDLGFGFEDKLFHLGGHSVHRAYKFSGGGAGMMKTAKNLLKKKGIPVLLGHEVVDILRDNPRKGRVKGVKVKHKGKEIFISAKKAIVMATGGFAANLTMRMKYVPLLDEKLGNTSTKYVTGDGIVLGKSILADTVGMDFIQTLPRTSPAGKVDRASFETFWTLGHGGINVNVKGKRFVNCMADRSVEATQILRQEKPVYVIYDEKIRASAGDLTDAQYRSSIQRGRIFKGNSIRELAEKAGIDSAGLGETIKTYNSYVEDGKDLEFGRPDLNVKIEKPPFYAIPSWTAVHYTMGGLLINPKTQVMDIWGNIIPGFYAVGEVAGGIHGTSRLGANALTEIWVFGRIAGKMAARMKPWV